MSNLIELSAVAIVRYAEENNLSYECMSFCKENNWDREAGFAIGDTSIGIELKKDVWYWFGSYNYYCASDMNIYFSHRYNRVNGACQKSWKKGYDAKKKILTYLNKENNNQEA